MPRQPRYVLPGQSQHVIQRGNNRCAIFCTKPDHRFYLEKLKDAADKHQCDVHAYVLMTNHVHLLVTPHVGQGISKMMQMIGRYYVQHFNYRYQRTGSLWEGRYKSTLVDSEQYLFTCMRYIELNPVRAGMVSQPSEYPWSSYRQTALGQPDEIVTDHPLYYQLGATAQERQTAYRGLFVGQIGDKTLDAIRGATNKGWVLGNDRFREQIASQLERHVAPKARGGDHKSADYRQRRAINRV